MKKFSSSCIVIFFIISYSLQAQNVGIGAASFTPNASAGLDVDFVDKGLLIPRVALTATNAVAPITAAATSILVYNTATAGAAPNNVTPGYYYWDGANWLRFFTGNEGWKVTGNSNTAIATNFLGTIDNVPFAIRTNNIERIRITGGAVGAGQVAINTTNPTTDDAFSSYANITRSVAVAGYASSFSGGTGVYGITSDNAGVWGEANNGVGIYGVNNSAGFGSVSGYNNNVASGIGGIFAGNGLGSGALVAAGAGVSGRGTTVGVYGEAVSGAGVYAKNNSAFSGFAAVTAQNIHATGVGGNFVGNNVASGTTPATGCGVSGSGTRIGVAGYTSTTTSVSAGGYFQLGTAGTFFSYVALNNAGTNYKIYGTGSVSTIVKNLENKPVTMFCPEAPEILFQDFGKGTLQNGIARIELDPIFTKNIKVDDNHPLRVFIQLEGDCNGVFVSNKTATSFDVKELQNGTSNIAFTWFVTANRADEKNAQTGELESKHEGVRFPDGLGPMKSETIDLSNIKTSYQPLKK